MHATCSAHLIRFQFIIIIMFAQVHKSWISALFNFLRPPLTSSYLGEKFPCPAAVRYPQKMLFPPHDRQSFTPIQNRQNYSDACFNVGSCDSVVCVESGLWAGRARYHVSTPCVGNRCMFSKASRRALVPTQPPTQEIPRLLSLGVKGPGREADHSLSSSDEA
jgi:hypothetical protein